ncbi:STAS domain-containing protein [Streptomyces minutiscleroticus]|uniref:STAS domain-containing protein n=1 Tax=Streptomyces minutiscleroticus TaxID=68238 RepID=UPI00332EC891
MHGAEDAGQLCVARTFAGTITVLSLQGELTVRTVTVLRRAVVADPAGLLARVVVDLEKVAFVDTSGFAALADLHRTVRHVAGWLRLAGIPPALQQIFELRGLDTFFDCYPTVDHALIA